jgi:hypothetical protein
MEIVRLDPQTVALRQIDPFTASLLRRIPSETDPGDDEIARERLFSKPVQEGQGKEFNEEWKQFIEPGIRHLFQSANETVFKDLKNMVETKDASGEEWYTLHIPVDHLEQWLNTLNQARLVMAARNAFTEQELAGDYPPIINSTRDMNLLQIHFYASMQEIFIREIE